MLRTFVIVCIGYVFDVAPSFRQAMWTFKMILTRQSISHILAKIFSLGITEKDLIILVVAAFVVFLISLIQEKSIIGCRVLIDRKPVVLEVFLIVVLLTIVLMFGIYGPTYNASDFVYAQF